MQDTIDLICKLLHFCQEYHLCGAEDPHCQKLAHKMTIFICEYCGLDSGAAKHSKGLLKMFLSCCCLSSPTTESLSKCCCCLSPVLSVKVVDALSEPEESAGVDLSVSVFPFWELCASLSTVQAEVGNVSILIDNLAACLASESKDLHATVETGFVCLYFLVWSVYCLHSLGQCFLHVRQPLVCHCL